MHAVLVSHTHWDREWYRTFQAFRARLVDTVDSVLDLVAEDPGYRFLLDGQSIVLEDYLEVRPGRRAELSAACRSGRIAIGPWYVQPDSLLPSGEAHVRNLLEGRRVAESIGPVSRIAYTPDSFGHPAQYPQLFAGFGLDAFVYWRGNGDEIASLPAEYAWVAPDGSAITACHLGLGYFNASSLPADADEAAAVLRKAGDELAERARWDRVLLMNGSDHVLPDANTARAAEALARETGWTVVRGLLEDFVAGIGDGLPEFRGELVGGRVANLLPGVWSTRTWIKLRNRAGEALLEGWTEPWAAIAASLGLPDERPSIRAAWRALLHNQAHDSICGCSQDAVHEQMRARYDTAQELAGETASRTLERLAGLGPQRRAPWTADAEIAVFNPSPHTRTDVVRFALDAYPPFGPGGEEDLRVHPLVRANVRPKSFTVDGRPARLVPAEGTRRLRLVPDQHDWELEFVASDVPAFGWRRMRLQPSDPSPDDVDDGRDVASGSVGVSAADDGTFTVAFGDLVHEGLFALEDTLDRGDSYDHDPVPADPRVEDVTIRRHTHASGIRRLEVVRRLSVPALNRDRSAPGDEGNAVTVAVEARVAPGVERVDLRVRVDNRAPDHRLRALFPTGRRTERARAATTFGVAERSTQPPDASAWRHPAPATFPHQGWVAANGLCVVAPGLPEAEVTPGGVIAITLLRCVGWLSRPDLTTRPGQAGPSLPTPGAQCVGALDALLSLLPAADPRAARDAELRLRAVIAGDAPVAPEARPLLELEPRSLLLSALKPAEAADGVVVRVLNPGAEPVEAVVRLGFPAERAVAVRLDESPATHAVALRDGVLRFDVAPYALRSVLLLGPGA